MFRRGRTPPFLRQQDPAKKMCSLEEPRTAPQILKNPKLFLPFGGNLLPQAILATFHK